MSPFDQIIDRRGTHCMKWDMMAARYDVDARRGIPMWVADMDFRAPEVVQEALARMLEHGIYGYFGDDTAYLEAIVWWMSERHSWTVDPAAIFTTHGLVNGTALCIDAFTEAGDGVVLFTPVYHVFAKIIAAAGREVTECPLTLRDGRYEVDLEDATARLTGRERMVILCSPHNPGGRVWSVEELEGVGEWAARHGLILVSDEIHHDLVMPGQHHTVAWNALPDCADRLVMLSSATKTFNLAGMHSGNVIVPDPTLRARFAGRMAALGMSPNAFGMHMTTAAYSPDGARWVDELMRYLDGNRLAFDAAIEVIPGLASMPLEATYLAWVDFRETGLPEADVIARVEGEAAIAANHGSTFGTGGEGFLRFNLATPRSLVQEATARLAAAFCVD